MCGLTQHSPVQLDANRPLSSICCGPIGFGGHRPFSPTFYACDLDFVFLEKKPYPDIVAVVDYKTERDDVSFSEVIAYNAILKRGIPVYIVQGDPETGAFTIFHWRGGHCKLPVTRMCEVHRTADWKEFEAWESGLRNRYKDRYKE